MWSNNNIIARGRWPGMVTVEMTSLAAARPRAAAIEAEVATTRRAQELLKEAVHPKAVRGRRSDGS